MPTFKIKIVQVYKCTREIELDVEADDLESATERAESGDEETPDFEDPRWNSFWDLENEEVYAL